MFNKKIYRNMSLSKLNKELLEAVSANNLELIEYLLTSSDLSFHANIHHRDNDTNNSLIIAFRKGYLEIIEYLLTSPKLKEIANIYPTEQLYSSDLIRFNCLEGNIEALKFLLNHPKLKKHFDIFEEDYLNRNCFTFAAINDNVNIIEILLNSIDKNNIEKLTHEFCQKILTTACMNGHINIIDYLLTSPYFKDNINISLCNSIGMNILMFSSSHLQPNLTKHLLNSQHIQLNINSQDYLGRNLLDIAILNKQLSLCELLIIEKNIRCSSHTLNILNKNKDETFSSLLNKIKIRDTYENLYKSINHDKIDKPNISKKVKV